MLIKKESRSRVAWRKWLKEIASFLFIVLVSCCYSLMTTPSSRAKLEVLWYEIKRYIYYDGQYRAARELNLKKQSEIRMQKSKQWESADIPYPVKEAFIELSIISVKRAARAKIKGMDSLEYKEVLRRSDDLYNEAMRKIPKNDPTRIALWMSAKFDFLLALNALGLNTQLSKEQIQEIENIIRSLLDATHSESRTFMNFTRFYYAGSLLFFLQESCVKHHSPCNANKIYVLAKRYAGFLPGLEVRSEPDFEASISARTTLLSIYLARLNALDLQDHRRVEVIRLLRTAMSAAEKFVPLITDNMSLLNEWHLMKKKVIDAIGET